MEPSLAPDRPVRSMKRGSLTAFSFLILVLVLLSACSRDPNARKAKYLHSGEKYLSKGKLNEAIIEFRNALEIDPRFAAAHYDLARAYVRSNNPQAAYRELLETVTLDPRNLDAELELASLLVSGRQFDQAQTYVKKVLKAEPNNPQAHAIFGETLAAMRDRTNAVAEFQKAAALDPHRIEYYVALSALNLALGQPADAEAASKQAVANNPQSSEAHVALAQRSSGRSGIEDCHRAGRACCQPEAVPGPILYRDRADAGGRDGIPGVEGGRTR